MLYTLRRSSLLLLALLLCAAPVLAASGKTKGLRYPSLVPGGKEVVFCYRGDVWIASVDGKGLARRLTIHEEQDTLTRVSPDGKMIAFSSKRAGSYDLYVVPAAGGVPKRITFHSNYEILCDWSPDGKHLLFTSQKEVGPNGTDLYEVTVAGGTPRRITFDGAREGSYSKDGKTITYIRGFHDIYWDNYTGSANYDIYLIERAGGTPRRATHTERNERWPCFSEDGKTLYFVTEEKGVANFYSMPAAGGKAKQVTTYKGYDVHRPDLGWDHKTVVFERAGKLYLTDITKPGPKPVSIPLTLVSDIKNSGIERRTFTGGCEQVDVSPDGKTLAFTVRGDIWTMPASGGTGTRITDHPANEQWPKFSPDGTKLAFFSNVRGNEDIYVRDLRTGATRPVTTNDKDDFFHCWSPDGRMMVFSSERSGNRDIWTINLETGYLTQLTKHRAPDDDPRFSPDGEHIAFDSGRDGNQNVYIMNADGTGLRRITQTQGFLQVPAFSPDGKHLVYEEFMPTTGQSEGLFFISTSGGPSVRLSPDGQTACFTPDGEYIYFHANRGPAGSGIFRVKAPKTVEVGEAVPFIGSVEVDVRKELGNLFDEAWNALRNGFYDPKMHGVNWEAMKKKYKDMAIDAENKDEFHNVMRQLLAELGASHLGIGGGQRLGHSVTPKVKENGYLGLTLEFEPAEGGGRTVRTVLPGGPAEAAGVRVGDVVTRIGSIKLGKKTNIDRATAGLANQPTTIGYRPLSGGGLGSERNASITPTTVMGVFNLQYRSWVQTCDKRVDEATKSKGGRVGYLHLNQMNPENLMRFQQAVMAWNRKDIKPKIRGMILDVRNNGGGNIHNQLMSVFFAKPLALVRARNFGEGIQPQLYWDKPVVLLINERSFSDAEVFPFMFRTAGIGPIIGVPTAGGVIGTNDITLSDGSNFRVPRTGFWSLDGKDLEGLGVAPDHLVEETAEDRLNGRDPQLAKAIELILAEIERREKAAAAAKKPVEPKKPTTPEKPKEPVKPDAEPAKPTRPEVPEKPVPPVAEPAKPVPAAGAANTLVDAKAGEWVRYRILDPETEQQVLLKITVESVEGGVIRFAKTFEEGATNLPFPTELPVVEVPDLLKSFGKVLSHSVAQGEIGFEDPIITDLLKAKVEWNDGSILEFTFTNAVPAYGLHRIEMNKLVLVQAIEWGFEAPAPEEPMDPKPEEPEEPEEAEAPDHPVYDAQVGEWIKIRQLVRNGQLMEMRLTVKEVTDEHVILSRTALVNDREIRGPDLRRKRDEKFVPPENFELTGYSREEVTVGEHTLNCHVMSATDEEGAEWQWYACDDVPVNGYVKVLKDGETMMELLEWGTETE